MYWNQLQMVTNIPNPKYPMRKELPKYLLPISDFSSVHMLSFQFSIIQTSGHKLRLSIFDISWLFRRNKKLSGSFLSLHSIKWKSKENFNNSWQVVWLLNCYINCWIISSRLHGQNWLKVFVSCVVTVALHTAPTIEREISEKSASTKVSFSCVEEIQPNTKHCSFDSIYASRQGHFLVLVALNFFPKMGICMLH